MLPVTLSAVQVCGKQSLVGSMCRCWECPAKSPVGSTALKAFSARFPFLLSVSTQIHCIQLEEPVR